jgi:hypothetical protein
MIETLGRKYFRRNKRLLPLPVVLIWIAFAVIAAYSLLFSIYWPFTKQAVIDTLQERSLRSVTIDRFHETYFPPGFIAEQVKFLHIQHKEKPPLLTINRLRVETSYPRLLTFQWKLETVRVDGLHLVIPAKEPADRPSPALPLTYSHSGRSVPIANLYAESAIVDFYRQSNPRPLRITVNRLTMRNINSNTALAYSVQLQNSEPPGVITSEGSFGPYNPNDLGHVPVRGSFRYENVNLGFFQALAGTLSAHGQFDGNLSRIVTKGVADVSDFRLTDTSHRRRVVANYEADVNVINGNVDLVGVSADFDRTNLFVKGSITGVKGRPGKDLSFDISSGGARVEDILDLFIAGKQAPLTGRAAGRLHVVVPAERSSFLTALTATGSFGIMDGKFVDEETERGLTNLSETATKPKSKATEDTPMVLSNLKGQVKAQDGLAHLDRVEFEMPGAHASLDGSFNLLNHTTEMYGVLTTKGDVSSTETGLRSFLLKALTPFLKRENHAKVVPFKIAGPYGNLRISVDLDAEQQLDRKR